MHLTASCKRLTQALASSGRPRSGTHERLPATYVLAAALLEQPIENGR